MGVNSLPKTVTRQRRDSDLNPGSSAPEFSTLTTRLPSHPLPKQPWQRYFMTNRLKSEHLILPSERRVAYRNKQQTFAITNKTLNCCP